MPATTPGTVSQLGILLERQSHAAARHVKASVKIQMVVRGSMISTFPLQICCRTTSVCRILRNALAQKVATVGNFHSAGCHRQVQLLNHPSTRRYLSASTAESRGATAEYVVDRLAKRAHYGHCRESDQHQQ